MRYTYQLIIHRSYIVAHIETDQPLVQDGENFVNDEVVIRPDRFVQLRQVHPEAPEPQTQQEPPA